MVENYEVLLDKTQTVDKILGGIVHLFYDVLCAEVFKHSLRKRKQVVIVLGNRGICNKHPII